MVPQIANVLVPPIEIIKKVNDVIAKYDNTCAINLNKLIDGSSINRPNPAKAIAIQDLVKRINSLRFMASSHDKLSSNLKIDQYVNLRKYYSCNQLSLLLRNGVYPYDYVDCLKKNDEKSLPPKESFYSKLTGEGITDEDYQHAHRV